MTLQDWLDSECGRLTAMAKHFCTTQSAISQWRTKGVPRRRMCDVRSYTGGAVTLEEMLQRDLPLAPPAAPGAASHAGV